MKKESTIQKKLDELFGGYVKQLDFDTPRHKISVSITKYLNETSKSFDIELGEVSAFSFYDEEAIKNSYYEDWEFMELLSIEYYPKEMPGMSHLKVKHTEINTDFNI